LVLGEGHGWASLSVPMDDAVPNSKSPFVRTPNFEKLAHAGIRFANFIFTTDHGTPGRNPPFSGGKGTIWEGGLRVPLIVRGPGIKPGACCHVRTVGVDLYPTIAQLAQVTVPQRAGLEGGSLVPLLLGGSGDVQRPREDYVVHFPHYDKDSLGPASSILWGDLKLIRVYETGQRLLFNLAQDPGERRDLAGQMPDKVQELDARLTQYLESVHAQLPTLNANFVPGADDQAKPKAEPRPAGKGGKGGKRRKGP
jgi:arylsulfatase A-like enzyme